MADLTYPNATLAVNYGDLESVTVEIAGVDTGTDAPAGTDLDSVVGVVKTYLEGLTGVDSVVAYRNTLTQTEYT